MSKKSKKLYSKRISVTTPDIAEDIKSDGKNEIDEENLKNNTNDHVDKNTKNHLGVMALIAIMKPATESQSFSRDTQPMKGHPSNKVKVLLDSGSDGDFSSYKNNTTNPFPTWLGRNQSWQHQMEFPNKWKG